MGVSRQFIYNLFENPKVDAETVSTISNIIKVDINKEVGYISTTAYDELITCKLELLELSRKYILLLEENNALLKQVNNKSINSKV